MWNLVSGSDLDMVSSLPSEEDSDPEEVRKSDDTCNLCYKWSFLKAKYIFYF